MIYTINHRGEVTVVSRQSTPKPSRKPTVRFFKAKPPKHKVLNTPCPEWLK